MIREKYIEQGYDVSIEKRQRTGTVWQVIFQVSTIVGIIALTALLLNILDSAFGYTALEAKVDPATLTEDGVSFDKQNKGQLVALLKSKISNGAYNKLEKEQPFAERSRANVYQLVIERIVKYDVKATWSLWQSLTRAKEISSMTASVICCRR